MSSVSKSIDQQKRRIKTLGRTSLLTFLLLTYLVVGNLLIITRPTRKIKTTKKVLNTKNKNRVIAMTFLHQVSMLSRKKKMIFLLSNVLIIRKRRITLISVFETQKGVKKQVIVWAISTPMIIS